MIAQAAKVLVLIQPFIAKSQFGAEEGKGMSLAHLWKNFA